MEEKPKRTGAIIGTIVAILLCGCPGLSLCVLWHLGGYRYIARLHWLVRR